MAGAPPKEIAVNTYERKVGSALAHEESGAYPGSFTLTDALNALLEILRGQT